MFKRVHFLIVIATLLGCCVTLSAQTSEQIETKILSHLNNLEKWSYRGGTGDFDALGRENSLLKHELLKYGRRSSTLKYDFPALAEKMFITTSKDRKFRVYSWDDQEGGSGRYFDAVYQYADMAGKAHTWSPSSREEGVVCSDFVHQIFQMDTVGGRIYLANGTSACSNALAYQSISILRIDKDKLNSRLKLIHTKSGLRNSIGFGYDFFSVVDHQERPVKLFFFDEAKKSFRFPVVLEDPKFLNGGRVTDKYITYRFNGKYFVKVT